jgi:hypothetical protein
MFGKSLEGKKAEGADQGEGFVKVVAQELGKNVVGIR